MSSLIETTLAPIAEAVLAMLPRAMPDKAALERTRLVAHRGQRDGQRVQENTFAAFDPVVDAGVAAIEFDVRFTRDDEPVVVHDADLRRVFGQQHRVSDLSWATLKQRVPAIPHLEAFLARYADRAHLLLELKTQGTQAAEKRLTTLLGSLQPVVDYHVLSLRTALFATLPDLPAEARVPVAKLNTDAMLDWTLSHPSAGLAGAQFFMSADQIRRLKAQRAFIGSGFIQRPGTLWREISRGVEWVFSNDPVPLQRALDRAIANA